MLLFCNSIQYTDTALRMPNNTYIIKIYFLIEYVFILAYFFVIIEFLQVSDTHFCAKSTPIIFFFCADYDKSP